MTVLDVYVENRSHFREAKVYALNHALRGLKREGIDYRVIEQIGPKRRGDVAFIHVDLTELPSWYQTIIQDYETTINGCATTISRPLYSKSRVYAGDDYEMPVIVKSILNHRGVPEFRYMHNRDYSIKFFHRLRKRLIDGLGALVCPAYKIYPTICEVPKSIWNDSRFIVERFLPGSMELPVVKFRYDFFYDVVLNTRSTFNSLLCEPETLLSIDAVDFVPEEVLKVRKQLRLDFGAIDYFMVKDQAFVIDANKTISMTDDWIARYPFVAKHLANMTDRLLGILKQVNPK